MSVNKTAAGVTARERSARPISAGVDIGHVHLKTADIEGLFKEGADRGA